jgi:tetratricopeptide (TPR) repeat protein
VRDDFPGPVKTVLAQRAAGRCCNPACAAVTSGPGQQPDRAINVGVAAHITAASSGGPRYDPALTPARRSAAENGIWLCQTCAKLIDTDPVQYTVSVLRQWKTRTEGLAAAMLKAGTGSADPPLELVIPSDDSPAALLSFASPLLTRVGREAELSELDAFLSSDQPFAWWLWTGPAGTGKSRLAVELCRAVCGDWHAGFLREPGQQRLGDLQALWPTLVVVDYAAQRSGWLSEAIVRLSQRSHGVPVRVLVLERAARGPWWDTFRRLNRSEESHLIDAAAYALPRELGGLSRDQIRALIRDTAQYAGAVPSPTDIEDIADRAKLIDPDGRPLFAVIAALDWLDGGDTNGGRDTALRRLAARLDTQTAERLAGSMPPGRVRNLRTLATVLGGIPAVRYEQITHGLQPSAGLLPGLFDDYQRITFDDLAEGVRPDILGELYILDRLDSGDTEHHTTAALLRLAWQVSQEAYNAFVERAAADHHEHPRLAGLLEVGDWSQAPAASARMAAGIVPFLRRSDHPALAPILARLTALQDTARQRDIDEIVAEARFRFANLVREDRGPAEAGDLYTALLTGCDPDWPVYAGALNNRGITWHQRAQDDAATADYTAVINAPAAAEEARACALNNRADIYDARGDLADAVADRTAVLALTETTFDRRYIARSRRARTLWRLGDHDGALQDIEAILATDDIVMEQKMAARLQRAEWLLPATLAPAITDLQTVIGSPRNFPQIAEQAQELLDHLPGRDPAGASAEVPEAGPSGPVASPAEERSPST